jgi:flagellar export protein FliJ
MPRDPLNVLLAVRQRTIDQRRQALADCVMRQADAAAAVAALDAAILRDAEAAATIPDLQHFRDIFIATRQHLTSQRQRGAGALAEADARSEQARRSLAAARLDAEAVERLISERALLARTEAERRAQHELDDIARSSGRSRGITRNCRL